MLKKIKVGGGKDNSARGWRDNSELKARAALSEDPGSNPSPNMEIHKCPYL